MKQVIALLFLCCCVSVDAAIAQLNAALFIESTCSATAQDTLLTAASCTQLAYNSTDNTTHYYSMTPGACEITTTGSLTPPSMNQFSDSACTALVTSLSNTTCDANSLTDTAIAPTEAWYRVSCASRFTNTPTATPSPTPVPATNGTTNSTSTATPTPTAIIPVSSNSTATPTPTPTSTPIPVLSAGMKLSHGSWALGGLILCLFQLMA